MAQAVFPAPSAGGGIKLVQRGTAASAGSITITSVNTAKVFVRSISEGSTGSIAGKASITGTLSPSGGDISGSGGSNVGYNGASNTGGSFPSYSGTRTLSGGTTDLTTKQFGVYLSNSTTLIATGACRWEVVEFA